MRGEPGDAMARMKRWEAVRQRLAEANGHGGHAAGEVVAAVADVVSHHEALTVTITVDSGDDLATFRVVRRQGKVEVTRLQPAPVPSTPSPPSSHSSPPPSPPSSPSSPPSPPRDMPWAGQPVNHQTHPAWEGPDPETLDQTAARLAELIRQDPSLLDGNP